MPTTRQPATRRPATRSSRRGGSPADPLGLIVAGVATVLAAVLAAGPVVGGVAAWGSSAELRSAPFSRATLGHAFVPRTGGGTGGAGYTSSSLLGLGGSTLLVDLVSSSTVPVRLSGTVTTANLLLGSRVTVRTCTVPWQASTCGGALTTVLDDVTVDSVRPVTWSGAPVPAGATLFLRATVSTSLANAVTFTAVPAPARAPGDRTAA